MTTYKQAGVDINAGNEFLRRIRPLVRSTFRPEVLGDVGGFGGLFGLPPGRFKEPVLVSGTDGVGTKLKVAWMMNRHDTIGIDLVAMCVNDVLVCGAEPLFFLDYFATGKLSLPVGEAVVTGLTEGCKQAGCALIGGETAEMPSCYAEGEYDLAGFAVGVVERATLIDGRDIVPGDMIVGLASTGLHSNGYSLARRVLFEEAKLDMGAKVGGLESPLGETLLTPTRIYVKSVLALLKEVPIKGLAHITGGGLTENLPRILPESCTARIAVASWPIPGIFDLVQQTGRVGDDEMYRVFNMGIGMAIVVAAKDADRLVASATKLGERAFRIGQIVNAGEQRVSYVKSSAA